MADDLDLGLALRFLSKLKKNNNKAWLPGTASCVSTATCGSPETAPKGYPADHPEIELLRRKQVCVTETFTDDVVASQRFPALAVQSMKAMKPFIDYLNRVTPQRGR